MHLGLKRTKVQTPLLVALGLVLGLVFSSSTAFAHAKLLRSQPEVNSMSKQSPRMVELWFSEELELTMSTIIVTDKDGKRVDKSNATLAEGNKKLQIDLEELGSGTYTVEWKALSTDQHTMKGEFTFAVAVTEKPASVPAANQPMSGQTSAHPAQMESPSAAAAASNEESGSTWMMSFVRWLQYTAMMSLVGAFAFNLLVLGPAFRMSASKTSARTDEAKTRSQRRILFISRLSVILLIFTTFVALVQQASAVFDRSMAECMSPPILSAVLTRTGYGRPWFLQLGAVLALTIILFLIERNLRRRPPIESRGMWWTGLIIGMLLLVAPSWTGHAAAAIKDFRLAVVTDWLHLVAGAFWVGGLFHLALTTKPILRGLDETDRAAMLHRIVRLFTRVAIPAVIVLVLAGLYNTWVHVESFGSLWSTDYGRTLLLKLLLVALMLVLGGLNNFHFGKKAARLSASEESNFEAHEHSKLEQGFTRSIVFEAALGVAVLLITAILVFQTPARSHPVMTSSKAESTLVQKRK